MATWWRRVRGAVGTGITWAVAWAPVAVVVGTQLIDPQNTMDEMWVMVGALPGFVAGTTFSAVLAARARNRNLRDLSVAKTGVWGAIAGLVTGILPFLLGDRGGAPILPLAVVVIPALTLMSGVSAAATLAIAQRGGQRNASKTTSFTSHQQDTALASIAPPPEKLLEPSAEPIVGAPRDLPVNVRARDTSRR